MSDPHANYEQKKYRLSEQIRSQHAGNGAVRLSKDTSNLFRDRKNVNGKPLNVRDFNNVLEVNTEQKWIQVEGMTSYERLVDGTLPYSVMPAVVPQLKTITIGGAVSGVGIESSSFKYGLPHETVQEMEVLLGHGDVVTCTPNNEHSDLYFGLPNSYGTLGYVLKLKILAVPVKRFVALEHVPFDNAETFFENMQESCRREDVDFVDGTVFERGKHFLTIGRFTDQAPYSSDYTWMKIYYRSIAERREDFLTVHDYIWRWDTDWFWCSKNLYAQNTPMRLLLGRKRLGSKSYTKVMRWNSRWGVTKKLNQMIGYQSESVIQDVDIPIENAPAFLDFFHREIGMKPIWVCPIGHFRNNASFCLYPLNEDKLYINFGFWGPTKTREKHPQGYLNRKIEQKVSELGGVKSLYSDAYYEEQEFWNIYNKSEYDKLKHRYDPEKRLKNLYQKTVLRE